MKVTIIKSGFELTRQKQENQLELFDDDFVSNILLWDRFRSLAKVI